MILMTCLEVKPGLRWVRSPTGGGMRGAADRALLKLDTQDKLERVAKAVQIGGCWRRSGSDSRTRACCRTVQGGRGIDGLSAGVDEILESLETWLGL
jgi:hypothetical protein